MEPIEIERETLGHALREDKRLAVPPNQRSYSWEPQHVRELYQDLADAIERGDPEYFLGSIVVVRTSDGSLEVNDGQQRLATTLILLAAIRDHYFRVKQDERARLIRERYIFATDIDKLTPEPRLRLSAQDHNFFLTEILLDPQDPKKGSVQATKPSHKRITDTYKIAKKHVKSILGTVGQEQHIVLNKWVSFLEQGARVIWVTVNDESTAYVIFETMNDRGLRLSAADLLKNYLYGKAQDRLPEVQDKWQSMVGALETIEADGYIQTYIRHLWISLHGFTRSRELFDKIKAEIRTTARAVEFAGQLEASSSHYAALLNPSHTLWDRYDPSARRYVATLGELGVEQIRPLILAALEHFKRSEIKRFLFACVCWSVRFLLTGTPSGTVERYYSNSAHDITQEKIKTVASLTKFFRSKVPADDEFLTRVASAQVSNARLARYYLRAMQTQKDGKHEPQYIPSDYGDITLEHILPRNPTNKYLRSIGLGYEDAKVLSRRLGNLVLLQASKNEEIGREDYSVKKKLLARSEYSPTKETAKHKEWSRKQINERQERLAKIAVLTWPLQPPNK